MLCFLAYRTVPSSFSFLRGEPDPHRLFARNFVDSDRLGRYLIEHDVWKMLCMIFLVWRMSLLGWISEGRALLMPAT